MKLIRKNLKKIIIGTLAVILVGFLASKFLIKKDQNAITINPKTVKAVTVKKGNLEKDLTLAGKVDAHSYANIQFQTAGKLVWVGVKEGDRVKRGQAIASLDKTQLQKQFQIQANNYLTNRSTFEDTQDQYKQTKKLFLLTDEIRRILDRTQYSLNNAVLNYELSDLAVRYATITSPINGIITNVDQPNPGVNIIPSSASFTVIDPSSIYFKSEIDEENVTSVKNGQETTITLDSYSDKSIDSKIDKISFTPVQGQTSTVYQIEFPLPLDNSNLSYRLGMNGDAKIKLSEVQNVLYVPVEAVLDDNDKPYVVIKNPTNKKFEKIYIKTGLSNDDFTEVIEGLNEGQEIIVTGA